MADIDVLAELKALVEAIEDLERERDLTPGFDVYAAYWIEKWRARLSALIEAVEGLQGGKKDD